MATMDGGAALRAVLLDCRSQFLCAQAEGGSAIDDFLYSWQSVCQRLDRALEANSLDAPTISLAHSITKELSVLSQRFRNVDVAADEIRQTLHGETQRIIESEQPSPSEIFLNDHRATSLPFVWVRPLLEYLRENLASPYPDLHQKRLLLDACTSAGWASITQRKLEDWLNMARVKMGYTHVLKSDTVEDDRKAMEAYVHRTLSGSASDREGIPAVIVRRIETMQRWVLNQYESRAARDQTSTWAHDVVDLVQRLSVPDDVGPDAIYDDDDEPLSSDQSDSDESDYSGSDTLYSDSDTDDDALPTPVLGAKRQYSGLGLGLPPARTVSRTKSNSSLNSHTTLADQSDRELSGARCAAAQSNTEHDGDRPTKRRRSSLDGSSDEWSSPALATVAENPPPKARTGDQPYRSQKRKRSSSDDDSTSPSKCLKQLDPPPPTQVPLADIDALSSICELHWDSPLPAIGLDVDVELQWDDLIDVSPLDDDPDTDDLFETVVASREPPTDVRFSWCKLQAYVLERMLRHGVHIVPSPDASPTDPTPSITIDASLFNQEELAYLSALPMQSLDVGQACVEAPDLPEPGPNCPDVIGLSQWQADLSVPTPSGGSQLASVDIDEWIASLLNESFST